MGEENEIESQVTEATDAEMGAFFEVAVDTLKSMATRDDYNATLRIISSVCNALK